MIYLAGAIQHQYMINSDNGHALYSFNWHGGLVGVYVASIQKKNKTTIIINIISIIIITARKKHALTGRAFESSSAPHFRLVRGFLL